MVRRGRVQVRAREGAWPRGWASGGARGSEAGPWRWLGCFGFFHFFLLFLFFISFPILCNPLGSYVCAMCCPARAHPYAVN